LTESRAGWLDWVRRLQAVAQNGLQYTSTPFERERWELVQRIAAEMAAAERVERESLAAAFAAEYGHATPKVDVRGVVFRAARVLLVRGLDDRHWTPPGGWAEVGERPSEAVEKEVLEESGYEVRAVKLLAVQDRDLRDRPRWPVHGYKLFFRCELVRPDPREPSPHETDGVGWFAEDDLPELSERVGAKGLAWIFDHLRDPGRPTDFD
jgi:ADP-ribose pyrophosphatase YjhB (NUDIX family)